jgi:hypothetical protein
LWTAWAASSPPLSNPSPDSRVFASTTFALRDSSQSSYLPLGAFTPERLPDQSYSGCCEGLLDLLAHDPPHALVGDHERVLAEFVAVLSEGGQEAPSLDVLPRCDRVCAT